MPPKRYFRARVSRPTLMQKRIMLLTRVFVKAGIPLRDAARLAGKFLRPRRFSQKLKRRRR